MRKFLIFFASVALTSCAVTSSHSTFNGLTFVHLNDTYRVGDVEDGTAGGFGRVATVVKNLQATGRDVRILHGGDFLYPSLESSIWDGEQIIDGLNFLDRLAPVYVVAGNHEFDPRSPEALIRAMKTSTFDWLGDNYAFSTGDAIADDALKTAFTIEHDGRTVGIFSLTLHADHGGNARSYLSIDKQYVTVAERVIDKFENEGVDAIVGLTHLHMWQDLEIARLRAAHPTLVFVAGGHDHEPEYSPQSATSAAVMKGASNAREIWAIDLTFDNAGLPVIAERRLAMNEDVVVDAKYAKLAEKWRSRLLAIFPFLEARIGTAAVPLDGREVAVRSGESNWGNFIADQMRGAFGNPVADFAFVNGGTLRIDDYIEDDILFEDIGRTFGFSSYLRHTTVSGAEFKAIMEAGYRGTGTAQGYFPQISGFRVCVDPSRNEGDRIVSLQVPTENGYEEIGANKTYSLVVPDFLYGGGDGYEIPQDRPASRPASELIYQVLDAVLDATARGESVGTAIDRDNRRYHELFEGKEPCFKQ